jgi:hypothetical protein
MTSWLLEGTGFSVCMKLGPVRARHQPGCAVPPGLASEPYATRHSRAGLQDVPSLRDCCVGASTPALCVARASMRAHKRLRE